MKYLVGTAKLAAVLAIIIFSACGDVSFLLPVENNQPEVTITSVSNGAILLPDDTFEVAVDYNDEEFFPDRLVIDLRNRDGEVLFSVELDSEGIFELPLPVELPADLGAGAYEVGVAVFQEEEEIAASNSIFFFVEEEYQIRAITAYPQIFYPGGRGLVIANLDIPENSNPYLRWSSDDVEIYAGLFTDGADKLQLEVPESEGVYTIRLEVFPFEPGGSFGGIEDEVVGEDEILPTFDFSSIISLEAQFFVSSAQGADDGELGPEKDYFSLFHFRGESVDWGYDGDGSAAVPVGTPILDISRGIFGFRFEGNDGFAVDKLLLPVVDGYIQPFSYSARFVLDSFDGSNTRMIDGGGEAVFSMEFIDGVLSASLHSTSSQIAPLFLEEDGADLTLTIFPDETTVRYLWFIDGVLEGDDLITYEAVEITPGGRTVIGGDGGMYGIIDELGVYYRVTDEGAEVDMEVFARAMERTYSSDLVLAEGFDGTDLPESITFKGEESTYSLDGGSLFLPAGSLLELSAVPGDFDSLLVEIVLLPAAGKDRVEGEENGLPAQPRASLMVKNTSEDTLLAEVTSDAGELTEEGVLSLYVEAADPGDAPLSVFIENLSDDSELEIGSVLVLKNQVESAIDNN